MTTNSPPQRSITLLLACLLSAGAAAQEAQTNGAPKIFRDKVEPHWFEGNNKFWYRVSVAADRHEFVLVDAVQGSRAPAFDHERLAKALNQQTGKTLKPDQLPFDALKFSDDGKWEAVVRGHNLFLRDLKTEQERPLTFDANPDSSYARDSQRDRAIEMEYDLREPETPAPEVYWSPDSRRLVALRTKPRTQRTVYLVESSPKDQLQPKLQSYPYLKPGDEVPLRKPHLFDLEAKQEITIDDALFSNPWSIGDLRWSSNSSRFTFLYNQRGHQVLRIVAVDAGTGEAKPVVDERSATFIC